jgi:hypothetical protein
MLVRKIISEQILSEGRLDDAKSFVIKDFQDYLIPQSYKEGRKMPEWFVDLVNSDPSGNQKYLMWALKEIKKATGKFHPFNVASMLIENLITGITNFHNLQNKLTKENIDKVVAWSAISNPKEFSISYGTPSPYFKFRYPIAELENIMKNPKDINSYYDHYLLFEITNAIKQLPSKSDIKKESIKLMDNDYWLVIIPTTHRSSCTYGAGTRWCTTAKEDVQFNRYQSNTSSLFYFIPKTKSIKDISDYFLDYLDEEFDMSKVALHINIDGDMVFYDASDGEIDAHNISDMVKDVYGLESAHAFWSGVMRAEDYHKDKIGKFYETHS